MSQCPVSAAVTGQGGEERRVLAPSTANQRATERERERWQRWLPAVVASSQQSVDIEPVAVLRNYTGTGWLATPPANTNRRIKIGVSTKQKMQTNFVCSSGFHDNPGMKHPTTVYSVEGARRPPEYMFN